MTPERWQEVKAVLAAALDYSPEGRSSFLDRACAADQSLRAEVESLIAEQQPEDGVIDSPAIHPGLGQDMLKLSDSLAADLQIDNASEHPTFQAGSRLGPYKIVREIEHGGVGTVYLAVRADDQYRQQVAIKVIRRGMDTDFVLRRFRNERQILASLDHPNIARLLDGGTTDDHRPYLVMEYVEGLPIDTYCDRHALNTEARLALFQQVCAAVHYAHQHLVIHRDIKPGNILVTEGGVPKLLDFGIAKLLTPELAAQTLDATAPALRLMTPGYASPEQIKGEPITTAADVYALGVLLHELLTGHKPYRVESRAPLDAMRAVLETEAARPSTAVMITETTRRAERSDTATITPESVSKTREGTPDRLRRRLRGDLDNIVLTALSKEPERRYASVQQFSEDIHRHLKGLPVIARADTLGYRTAKFIRRNRLSVAAAAFIVITLLGGIIVVNQQRNRAERRFNDVRKLAHSVMFDYHDAIADLPGSTPVRQRMVKDALEYLDSLAKEAAGDQTLQRELATAYSKIGDVQGNSNVSNLGDTSGALSSYRKSLAIRQVLAQSEPTKPELQTELAESHEHIGDVLRISGDVQQADKNYQEAVRLLEKVPAGGDRSQQRRLADLLYRVGNLKGYPRTPNLGDTQGAIEYHRRALAIREALSAADPKDTNLRVDLAESHRSMVNIFVGPARDPASAEPHARQAVVIAQSLVMPDTTNVRILRVLMNAQDSLARLLMVKNETNDAAEVSRDSLKTAERMLAIDPRNMQARLDLATGHTLAGNILTRKGDPAAALMQHRQALMMYQAIAADDPNNESAARWIGQSFMDIATALVKAGDLEAAVNHHQQAVAVFEALQKKNPADTQAAQFLSRAYDRLGETRFKLGDGKAALENFQHSVPFNERVLIQDSGNDAIRRALALTYFNIGELGLSLAGQSTVLSGSQQTERCVEARKAYQRSLDLFLELRTKGALLKEHAGKPDQIIRKIAVCDRAVKNGPIP